MNNTIKHYHGLQIKTLPATNTKETRIKIISLRHNTSKIINYDYSFNSTKDIAIDYLQKNGVEVLGFIAPETTALSDSYILWTDDFEFMSKAV
jgi:hypothetical protein